MSAYVSHGTVTLPDGRQVKGHCDYWLDHDTNALCEIEDSYWLEWVETGEELTAEESNQEVEPGRNVWEYVFDKLPAVPDLGDD